jgi:GTP-binding protein
VSRAPFIVAIAGRPNAGKSTLFNRMLGRRHAIVHETPGVTRDENRAFFRKNDNEFELIDTGGIESGGVDGALGRRVEARSLDVLGRADVVLYLLDGAAGFSPADREVASKIRQINVPLIVAINKIDGGGHEDRLYDFAQLGIEKLMPLSSAHGRGMRELWAEINRLRNAAEDAANQLEGAAGPRERLPSIALIGRPNVGKSSLLNQLAGFERSLVDSVAGTTRDAVDSVIEVKGRRYRFVDTAGLRKKGRIHEDIEGYAANASVRALVRAQVGILLLDAQVGVTDQDLKLADLAWRKARGLVFAVNKMDLTPELSAEQCHEQIANLLPQWPPVPLVQISATTGKGVPTLLLAVDQVLAAFERRISTADLNRLVEKAVYDNPPPLSARKRPMRILYATQARTSPPEIALFTTGSEKLPESWQRYLMHRLREAAGWVGVPVRLSVRTKKGNNPFVGSQDHNS